MARTRGQKGFTLIEVLVSLLILAIGCLSVIIMFTVSIKTNKNSTDRVNAYSLAQRKLEELVAMVEQRPAGAYPINQAQQQFPGYTFYNWSYRIQPTNVIRNGVTIPMQAIAVGIYWPATSQLANQERIILTTTAGQIANL